MTKQLTVESWNLLDGINNPEVQSEILAVEPDIGVFPEAAHEDEGVSPETAMHFANAGYDIYSVPYDDNDGRKDRHVLAMIAKHESVVTVDAVRLSGRTALFAQLANGADFMGLHFDDREEHNRLQQAIAAIAKLGDTALAAGDMNALYGNTPQSRWLRIAGPLARLLPSIEPGIENPPKLPRLGSLAQRTVEMADGATMRAFMLTGFKDASEDLAPTMVKGPLALQLDHILYRGNVDVLVPTQVDPAGNLSDHRRIVATLAVTGPYDLQEF